MADYIDYIDPSKFEILAKKNEVSFNSIYKFKIKKIKNKIVWRMV